MRRFTLRVFVIVFFVTSGTSALIAQTGASPDASLKSATTATPTTATPPASKGMSSAAYTEYPMTAAPAAPPFTWMTVGGSISSMGVSLQTGFMLTRTLSLRSTGGMYHYPLPNRKVNGLLLDWTLNFANAGAALDYYPLRHHGFRISPGLLFYTRNSLDAVIKPVGGLPFTFDGNTYYSSPTSPVVGTGSVNLHTSSPAFTVSAGSRNIIPHGWRGLSRWSFPFEAGVAFIGQPTLSMAFTGGQACSNAEGTLGCVNAATDPGVNGSLHGDVSTDTHQLAPARFYPIISFGVAYTFRIRGNPVQ